ncbi:hypothetical protein IKP94_03710 [Candidatus Saccharibacteria bacterium]|nr:hypothetical protein [Candidatus Saccharibacteria bacterium]
MSDLLCFATIALAGFAQASLQLSFGGLILLYHASMGQHRRRKTRHLTTAYILGALVITMLAVSGIAFWISQLAGQALTLEMTLICAGMFIACAAIMWLLYYRRGKNTELWLPRSFTRFIARKAKSTDDSVEAFSLGTLSAFAEMPMSIAIFFVVANCILTVSAHLQLAALLSYLLIVALPMLALKFYVRTGNNAVMAQRWRIKNKTFIRFISSLSFMMLSVFVLTFWVY